MSRRGGPQRIPRPERWWPGEAAPWAGVDRPPPTLEEIERALRERGAGAMVGDPAAAAGRHSAVLVPLYEDSGEAYVVLTRRAPHMRSHTHEVAFPGGRIDADDRDEWAAALREAHEEVALDPALPRRVGQLDSFVTGGSMSLVTPLVGALPERPELRANEEEVEHILHVPVAELLLPEVFREEIWTRGGLTRAITFFELHGDTVWGATGAMLRQLLGIITGTDDSLSH